MMARQQHKGDCVGRNGGFWRLGCSTFFLCCLAAGSARAADNSKAADGVLPKSHSYDDQDIAPVVPTDSSNGYWGLQLENDLFAGLGSDRYYTQGMELSYAHSGDIPEWLNHLGSHLPGYEGDSSSGAVYSGVVYSLGQKMYTPADITANPPDPTDRPYAGFLYGTLSYVSSVEMNPNLQHVNVFEFMLGVVGPSSRAKEFQNYIHTLLNLPEAQGWNYQLKDELGLGASYIHKWRHFDPGFAGKELEWSPHITLTLGNVYTYLASGVMVRWGRGLKMDMGPPNIRPGFTGSSYFVPHFRPNWYLFMGVEERLVARNIFLDGNTLVDGPRVKKEPLVGDLQMGFAIHKGKMRFAFSNVFRSREFTTQTHPTRFGSLNFSYYF